MRRRLIAVAGLSALITLGCGGLWDEAAADANAEEFQELIGKVSFVQDSPEKDQVVALLEQGYLDASAGRFGIVESSMFALEVEDVIADNQITGLEVTRLQNSYAELGQD